MSQSNTTSALVNLVPLYAECHVNYGFSAVVTFEKDAPFSEVQAAADQIDSDSHGKLRAGVQVDGKRLTLNVYGNSDEHGSKLKDLLMEIVNPRYTARATGSAKVIRMDGRSHVATIVTITIADGKPNQVSEEKLGKLDGVDEDRAKAEYDQNKVHFAMKDVTTNRKAIEEVTSTVADALRVHLVRPVTVHDENPLGSLVRAYDAKPSKKDNAA